MSAPHASVLVTCFNYGRFLAECLESALAQEDAGSLEVIVVDDASTDETPEVLARVRDPRVQVVRHERNRGVIASINAASALARGALVIKLDADDRLRPGFLARASELLAAHPQAGALFGDVALIDEAGELLAARAADSPQEQAGLCEPFLALLERNTLPGASLVVRSAAWRACLPFPAQLVHMEDWYLKLTVARHNPFYYLPEVLADYRVHPSNCHVSNLRSRREEAAILHLLERVFSSREPRAALEQPKRARRRRAYASQHLGLADGYFGAGMAADARRCYRNAFAWHPPTALRHRGALRRWTAARVGLARYEAAKSTCRRLAARLGRRQSGTNQQGRPGERALR